MNNDGCNHVAQGNQNTNEATHQIFLKLGPTRKKKDIYQWSGGGGRGYTHVSVWQNNSRRL